MTVKELILKLQQCHPDSKVVFPDNWTTAAGTCIEEWEEVESVVPWPQDQTKPGTIELT